MGRMNFQGCLVTFCAHNVRRRTFLIAILGLIGVLTTFNYLKNEKHRHLRIINDCFQNSYGSDVKLLHDIVDDESVKQKDDGGKKIWFLETSCSTTGHIKLNSRQMCAIESAAKNNPHAKIYVLFAANVGFSNESSLSNMLHAVLDEYSNIHLKKLNLSTYADETPMQEWMQEGVMFESNYVNSHLSDVLRYLTLYKYGGTYLDLDVVVLKNLDIIGVNYSGAESNDDVAAGVMNFERQGFGHQVAEMCVKDLLQNFNGFDWGNNGPGVITRVLQSICLTTKANKMTKDRCYGFTIYPPEQFYVIPWRQHAVFFNETVADSTLKRLEQSTVAHLWNKHSHKIPLRVGSKAAYGQLAERHCPITYASCGEYF